jgi:hypothetical protein
LLLLLQLLLLLCCEFICTALRSHQPVSLRNHLTQDAVNPTCYIETKRREGKRRASSPHVLYARLPFLSCTNSISSLISNLILPQSLSLSLYGLRLFSLPFWGIRTRWTSFRLTAALIERSYARCFVQSLQMKPRSQKTVLARRFPPPLMMHSTGLNCIAVISHFHSLCLRLSFCETHTKFVPFFRETNRNTRRT